MKNQSLSFKIIASITVLGLLILFSCIYCILMINKTQTYAQETGTNWMPSIEAMARWHSLIGNASRRSVLVMANSVAKYSEGIQQNLADIEDFK